MNFVAPSPSRTIACASRRDTSTTASRRTLAVGRDRLVTGALPARWVAISTNESLVDVSPSIVMQLNDSSAASVTSCCTSAGSIAASVATKPSIVAMFGRIMPAPLLMPVTATVLPPSCTVSDAALGTVSVVMIASAASAQASARAAASAAGNRPRHARAAASP